LLQKMVVTVGVDIGSQKTMIVRDDAEIVLTETGSINRATLISFFGKTRLCGEEASAQASGDSAIPMINLLAGKTLNDTVQSKIFIHQKCRLLSDSNDNLCAEVTYCENKEVIPITALLGMFIAKLWERITAVNGPEVLLSFALTPNYLPSTARAYIEACEIAGVDTSKVSLVDASDCLVSTYERKIAGLRAPERALIEGKNVVLIDMGHTQTTIVVVKVGALDSTTATQKLSVAFDEHLGSFYFDLNLFEHFSKICETKTGSKVEPASKKGYRLLLACERIRKLLSQLPDAQVTVENMSDAGDLNFSLRREDLSSINTVLLEQFKKLIITALTNANISLVDNNNDSNNNTNNKPLVEVMGGGVRMQVVQNAINQVFGENTVLGAKFDDSSVALGAALIVSKKNSAINDSILVNNEKNVATINDENNENETIKMDIVVDNNNNTVNTNEKQSNNEESHGLSSEEILNLRKKELSMQKLDIELKLLNSARNEMESFILEMRGATRQKFGDKINASELNRVLDDNENWLWDNIDCIDLSIIQQKINTLQEEVNVICKDFFELKNEEKKNVEKKLDEESLKRENEKSLNGEEDEDHDNRKLKKNDRMRLVVKNKEEGTELFRGGNFRPAAARYHKALTHASKFFDLTKADEEELKELKKTIFLNLASCYIKLESWEQVLRNCDEVLQIEYNNIKALYRRSIYYENKKDWEKALLDIKKCQELNDVEDKLVTKASERIKKEIQKEKNKEKKMWGKAFS